MSPQTVQVVDIGIDSCLDSVVDPCDYYEWEKSDDRMLTGLRAAHFVGRTSLLGIASHYKLQGTVLGLPDSAEIIT